MTDATGKYDLYHAFAEPGQKLDFTVTAIGTSLVDMYVNDVLVGETRLGTEPPVVYGNKPASPGPIGARREATRRSRRRCFRRTLRASPNRLRRSNSPAPITCTST